MATRMLRTIGLNCRRWRPSCNSSLMSMSSKSKKKVTFEESLGQHLVDIKSRHLEMSEQLMGSDKMDVSDITRISKDCAELSRVVILIDERKKLISEIADLVALEKEESSRGPDGDEMATLIRAEISDGNSTLLELEDKIVISLTPRDDADERGIVLEVRAGTGGDEASLFAGEVFKMYQKYAEHRGWRWEELSFTKTEVGGFKEAQASLTGEAVFKSMKFESGVHRVQRIPDNDTRIQTSAVSVVVLPEAEELDVEIRPQDLKVDVFRSQGAGGQSVNKTDSAVRLTHLPTGCIVSMQDERSQIQNRAKALKYLRARIYDVQRKKAAQARNDLRTAAQGTGDRSDKIRTYNFPQDRVTDHRVGMNVSGVERVLNGEYLTPIIDALSVADERDSLEFFLESLEQKRKDAAKSMKK